MRRHARETCVCREAVQFVAGRALAGAGQRRMQAGIVLAVGFNRRFHPSMALLREAVPAVGSALWSRSARNKRRCTGFDGRRRLAGQAEEAPAGAMTAIGVHLVDGMIDLFGPIHQVYAEVARRAAPLADDTTDVLLRFANGASGHIFCSTAATPHYPHGGLWDGGVCRDPGPSDGCSGWCRRVGAAMAGACGGDQRDFNMLTAELEAFAA